MQKLQMLTKIEKVYVELAVVSCKSRKEISAIINRSENTVDTQFKNIYRKLQITEGIPELSKIYYGEEFGIKTLIETKARDVVRRAFNIMNKAAVTLLAVSLCFLSMSEYEDLFRIRRNRKRDDSEFALLSDSLKIVKIYSSAIHGN